MGIRPEDIHDEEVFINSNLDSVVKSKIKVYELLGAEVYLYFDVDGTPGNCQGESQNHAPQRL